MEGKVQQLLSEARSLFVSFQQGSDVAHIDKAVTLSREALSLCRPSHPRLPVALTQLASHLWHRYKQLGGIDDLNEAVALDREALVLRPPGDPNRSTSLSNLALHLNTRFEQLGEFDDLKEAIDLERSALVLRPSGHPDRPTSLSNLALHLITRYGQLGETGDLNEAIALEKDALALRPHGHPDRPTSLSNLALHLITQYVMLGVTDSLSEAIVLERDALSLRPPGNPDRSTSLNNLAFSLFSRYNQLGESNDLNEAIALERDALMHYPPRHPGRSTSLSNLALHLITRYTQFGGTDDMKEAIVLERDALTFCPPGHPDRSTSLGSLGLYLFTQYNQLGEIDDLNEAIILARDALALRPLGNPVRPTSLSNLALYLSIRYNVLRGIDDLDEAIALSQSALEICPPGHQNRWRCLNNLALHLSTRNKQLGGIGDLDETIRLARDALLLCPSGHHGRSISLSNLALHLSTRYKQLGGIVDLDEAISLAWDTLELCPPGHPSRSTSLNNLAEYLSSRHEKLGETQDLDKAIDLARDALALCPPEHPNWSTSLSNLTEYLRARFAQRGELEVREELFSFYSRLTHTSHMGSSSDISAAKEWVNAAEHFDHPTTLLAYETVLRLLVQHLTALPSLPHHLSVFKDLSSSLAADAFSACLRNGSFTKAVELLEQGRGVFWSQLNRLRSPLDDVIAFGTAGKALADEFTRLSSLIRNALDSPGADQHDRVCRLNLDLQRVVSDIRELPGFSRFLLPPSFSDLQHAASGGPIIIVNASKYGCDALVVFVDKGPVHIPLSVTKEGIREMSSKLRTLAERARSTDVTRELSLFLRELWDKVVSYIVGPLQTVCLPQSRIWWCPTAEFSLLPLHAAAPYRKGQKGASDLYTSSYTPTFTALMRARRPGLTTSGSQKKHFIAIGQANASGTNELPSVGVELADIGRLVDDLATFTRIEGPDSCVSRVADELNKNDWVHFACHGIPNRKEPFESAFALHDGRFTIRHISRSDLQKAEFAYLSACHTTVGDVESPDEMIHLASAMQFAGFRSVIGTMWAVADDETNKITLEFYRHVKDELGCLDHSRAALALQETMKSVKISLDQRILYVHLGA